MDVSLSTNYQLVTRQIGTSSIWHYKTGLGGQVGIQQVLSHLRGNLFRVGLTEETQDGERS